MAKKATKRRSYGEGSIFQRSDGKWVGKLTQGLPKPKFFYGRTKKEVAEKLSKARYELSKGIMPADGRNYGCAGLRWVAEEQSRRGKAKDV
jgi:hypothetical protein